MKDKSKYNTKHYPFHIKVLQRAFPLMEKLIPSVTNKLVHKFFFYPVEFPYPEIEQEWLKKAQTNTFNFEGDELKLYEWGNVSSENKILLVHGWAGRATQYWKIIESLVKQDCHIISYDAPGHGKSDGSTTNLPQIASIINALREKFAINNLCGHSLGGAASIFALKHKPQEIRKLILISAPTKASLMLDDFLFKLNAGKRSKVYVQKMIKEKFDFPLDYFFAETVLPLNNFPSTLAFHDHEDSEVSFEHLDLLKHSLENVKIVETDDLGHTKILRKDFVLAEIVKFLD